MRVKFNIVKLYTCTYNFTHFYSYFIYFFFIRYLGNLTVWFDDQGEVVDWDGNPLLLDQSIEEGKSLTHLTLEIISKK